MGHSAKPIMYHSAELDKSFSKLAMSFKGTKINSTSEGLHHPSFKSLASSKENLVLRSGPYGSAVRISNFNNSANSKQNLKKLVK
jgi:hypothetical protein